LIQQPRRSPRRQPDAAPGRALPLGFGNVGPIGKALSSNGQVAGTVNSQAFYWAGNGPLNTFGTVGGIFGNLSGVSSTALGINAIELGVGSSEILAKRSDDGIAQLPSGIDR